RGLGSDPVPASLRRAEAGCARTSAGRRAQAVVAGRAGIRAVQRRDGRPRVADSGPSQPDVGVARGAPHGPRHAGLRPDRRPRLRPRHRKRYAGRDLLKTRVENVVHAGIAHVPEGRGVITELTVEENLRLGALFHGDRAAATASLGEMYAMFPPLAERRRQPADTLSGGE